MTTASRTDPLRYLPKVVETHTMRVLTNVLDVLLWALCAGAVIVDVWSLSRSIRSRLGKQVPSGFALATVPIYWARIAFLTLPWTARLIWVRIAEMFAFLAAYGIVMLGLPRLVPRAPRQDGPRRDTISPS